LGRETILNPLKSYKKNGTDRLEIEKGKNWKLESSLFPLFCVVWGKREWIKKKNFGQTPKNSGVMKITLSNISKSGAPPNFPKNTQIKKLPQFLLLLPKLEGSFDNYLWGNLFHTLMGFERTTPLFAGATF
jgi:hypothetical protein